MKLEWFKPEVRGYSLDVICRGPKASAYKPGDFAKLKKAVADKPELFTSVNVFDLEGKTRRLCEGRLSVRPDGTVGGELTHPSNPPKTVTVSIHETNKKMVVRVEKIR